MRVRAVRRGSGVGFIPVIRSRWHLVLPVVLSACVNPASASAAEISGPTAKQAWLAKIVYPTSARTSPGGDRVISRLGTKARWAGGPNQLLVLESRRDADDRLWLRVQLPIRPNFTSGWISADYVRVTRTRMRIEISTRRRTVSVLRSGVLVKRFRAVVGKPATPTPEGRFAVSEIVRQPDPTGFVGPWMLHLTAFSNVLDNFGGGRGRVAIHGRAGASLLDPLGSARSHGCIRVSNAPVRWLAAKMAPGVPVDIRR